MRKETIGRLFMVVFCALAMASAARAGVIYVDAASTGTGDGSSWTNAYPHLQDALAAAAEVNEPVVIRVAQGIYKPDQGTGITPGDQEAMFQLVDGITLRGGYAGASGMDPDARDTAVYATILSGDLHGDDDPNLVDQPNNCLNLITVGPTDEGVVIDGFQITAASSTGLSVEGGTATIRDCTFEECGGTAISGWNCRLIVTNCVFPGSGQRQAWRRGLHCRGFRISEEDYQPSEVKLKNCIFSQNHSGAVDAIGTLDLDGCSFANSHFGAILCLGSVVARRCVFTAHEYTAIDCGYDSHRPEVAPHCTLEDCRFLNNSTISGPSAVDVSGASLTATRCVFLGNFSNGIGRPSGAVRSTGATTHLSNCLFAGNWSRQGSRWGPGAVEADGSKTQVTNCTFVSNRGQPSAINLEAGTTLTQCIVSDCPNAFDESGGTVTYSNIQGGFLGLGNIDVDPCFIDLGYWQTNGTPDDSEDDLWVPGNYHIKSQAGHWDEDLKDWIYDETTSPCIDAGDPNAPLGNELFPNGGFVNLGAYGGTTQASRTYFGGPVCETQIAGDINGDCKVDDLDMDILLSHWLMPDIGRINTPPTVSIISPADGAELSAPTSVLLQADTSDPDGTVLRVKYLLFARRGASQYVSYYRSENPTNNWARELRWSLITYDGLYTLWAWAEDNEGATTRSDPITITLHP